MAQDVLVGTGLETWAALTRVIGRWVAAHPDALQLGGLDTLAASNALRQLRDLRLLEPRGKGSATHYVLGAESRTSAERHAKTGELAHQTGELDVETNTAAQRLSAELRASIGELGGRPAQAVLRAVILETCRSGWWTPSALAEVLGRKNQAHLSENHLAITVKNGEFERRYPDMLVHPKQAYRARQVALPLAPTPEAGDKR